MYYFRDLLEKFRIYEEHLLFFKGIPIVSIDSITRDGCVKIKVTANTKEYPKITAYDLRKRMILDGTCNMQDDYTAVAINDEFVDILVVALGVHTPNEYRKSPPRLNIVTEDTP